LYLAFNLESVSTTIYGPGFFPKIVLVALGFFTLVLLINTIKKIKNSNEKSDVKSFKRILISTIAKRVLLFIVLLIAYVTSFVYFGFLIPTVIFLIIAQIVFTVKKAYIIALSSIAGSVIMYLLFVNLFNIPLP